MKIFDNYGKVLCELCEDYGIRNKIVVDNYNICCSSKIATIKALIQRYKNNYTMVKILLRCWKTID